MHFAVLRDGNPAGNKVLRELRDKAITHGGDAVNEDTLNSAAQEQNTRPSYDGTVQSPSLSGEVKLTVDTDGLLIDSLFDQAAVSYADMTKIACQDFTVKIGSLLGDMTVSRMGQQAEWFYRELLEAYHRKVLQTLLTGGKSDFETEAQYAFDGCGEKATIRVFKDCLCLLPPNTSARRLPFVFLKGLKKEANTLSLTLATEERFVFSMLGHDLDPLEKQITEHIRRQGENNTAFIQKLVPSLGFSECAKAARLLPEGIAVSTEQLRKVSPSLAAVLEKKIRNSKMSETYGLLKDLCNAEQLAVGIKALSDEETEALKAALLEKLNENAEETAELTSEQEDALRWILWAAIPSADGKTAVVEFAFPNEDAATYVFRINGTFNTFLPILNRALEATKLQREILSLSDDELKKEQYADYRMAVDRTPSLQEIRKVFVGRVIHRSADSWKKAVLKYTEQPHDDENNNFIKQKFCTNCGAQLSGSAKFCGECGTKV